MRILLLLLVACYGLPSCKNKNNDPCAHDFDQLPMLANLGNNVILPRYAALETRIGELSTAAAAFAAQPQQSALDTLRQTWEAAYLQWQRAAIFEFGPAETQTLRSQMGLFPVFTGRIEDNISTGVYDLTAVANEYARGLPALEYLIYGVDTSDAAILVKYTSDPLASARLQYLGEIVDLMAQKVAAVHQAWRSDGGNYLATFTTTVGVAEGTPVSLFVNQLNAHYEHIKNTKIGVPVGAKTSYIVAPDKVEAYFHRSLSLPLAIAALQGSLDAFSGVHETNGTDGLGLDDYVAATGVQQNNQPLQTVIKTQYQTAKTALEALQTTTLYEALSTQLEAVKTAYAHLQNQVIYLKTDMPAVLCVSITYVDNTDDSD